MLEKLLLKVNKIVISKLNMTKTNKVIIIKSWIDISEIWWYFERTSFLNIKEPKPILENVLAIILIKYREKCLSELGKKFNL